jgi:hypothetical protein
MTQIFQDATRSQSPAKADDPVTSRTRERGFKYIGQDALDAQFRAGERMSAHPEGARRAARVRTHSHGHGRMSGHPSQTAADRNRLLRIPIAEPAGPVFS